MSQTTDPNAPAPAPPVDPNAPAPPVDPNAPAPPVDPNAPAAPAPDDEAAEASSSSSPTTSPTTSSSSSSVTPSLKVGGLVAYDFDDPIDGPQRWYGFVVAEPDDQADPPEPNYRVRWLPPGEAALPADDLSAV